MNCRVSLTTKIDSSTLEEGTEILVLNPDGYDLGSIEQIKTKGYKVLAYLSISTIKKDHPWYFKYKRYKLGELNSQLNEVYVDVRERDWRDFVVECARAIREKGFDGWWLDNLDIYEHYKSAKMFIACNLLLKQIKRLGGYVMVNGGSEFFSFAIDQKVDLSMVDGVMQGEVFSLVTSYERGGKFSRQKKIQKEFYEKLLRRLRKGGIDIFLLEYTRSEKVKDEIKRWAKENKASYYIVDFLD